VDNFIAGCLRLLIDCYFALQDIISNTVRSFFINHFPGLYDYFSANPNELYFIIGVFVGMWTIVGSKPKKDEGSDRKPTRVSRWGKKL